jgi:hypothetical protein
LNGICEELGLTIDHGTNAKNIRNAFLQNALTGITAKFNYKANDGTERRLEAGFTRYSVIFTGEKLPDGRKADAVYIIFNEPFWEVLNNAPVRPLDRAYMKALPPAAQRFYEIISRKMFAALKNDYAHAKIAYSEYCTFSAQLRHFERQRVQDQMAKIIRHHKESDYITAVKYQATIDAQNRPDWMLYLAPGPRARAEFAAAHGGRKTLKTSTVDTLETGERPPKHWQHRPRKEHSQVRPIPPLTFDPALVAEFTRRGITEKKALELLTALKPGQDVVAQLELGEYMAKNSRIPIVNPPGFYVRLIESNTSIPESFETNAKRQARQEKERKEQERRVREEARQELEWEYDIYSTKETQRFIAENPTIFEAIKHVKREEDRERYQHFSPEMLESFAESAAKREIQKQVPLLTLEEFADRKQQNPDFLLKPVGLSPAAELEMVAEAAAPQDVAVTDATAGIPPDPPAMAEERGETDQPAPEAATQPPMSEPEPAIEFVSAPPPQMPGGNAAESGMV